MKAHFPFDPTPPEALFYTRPQYNTWVELLYQQNQEGVLAYARSVLANGLAPGVLMIDDTWQEDYGLWRFHPGRFPNPKAMCRELHDLGFSVMVWLVPYLSADSPSFRKAQALPGALLRRADGEPCCSPGGTATAPPWTCARLPPGPCWTNSSTPSRRRSAWTASSSMGAG